MVRVLLRAAPWPALLGLSAVGTLTAAVAIAIPDGPGITILQLSLAVIAGAAACAVDEPAAAVVMACPVRRSTQTLVRALAASAPLLVGAAAVLAWWVRTGVDRMLLLELVGGWVLGFALAVVARRWLDEPAEVVASGLLLLLVTTMLVGPVARRLALYPSGDTGVGVRTWWTIMAGCVVAMLLVVRDEEWRSPRVSRRGHPHDESARRAHERRRRPPRA
jgi:hypothetical protein